jgi:DNA-binding HxlR family transcriptional regulator
MTQRITGEKLEGLRSAINSLKLANRADLIDEKTDASLIKELYVDPSPNSEILRTLRAPTTSLLIGRKGTGKSTIFQRLQYELRESRDAICAYIDIKAVFDHAEAEEVPKSLELLANPVIEVNFARQLSLANSFISLTVKNLIEQLATRASESILDEIRNALFRTKEKATKQFKELMDVNKYVTSLDISKLHVRAKEITQESGSTTATSMTGKVRASHSPFAGGSLERGTFKATRGGVVTSVGETLLRQFNFSAFTDDLKKALSVFGIRKVFLLVDDFSELPQQAMEVFIKDIIAPLNNSTHGLFNFKIAAYPGRIYLGDIDRSKIDEVALDAFELYGARRSSQQMEEKAIEFMKRLLNKRITHYCGVSVENFFEDNVENVWEALYHATFANPRTLGYILSYAIQEQERISVSTIKYAAERYYNEKVETFFFTGRFSDQSLTEKASIVNLKRLLEEIIFKAVSLKSYNESEIFQKLRGVPPTSHFYVQKTLEETFSTLELNGFVSRYLESRDREGRMTTTYAMNYGLCHKMNIKFGCPPGEQFRQFFRERVFDYSNLVGEFLTNNHQIKCPRCNHEEGQEALESLRKYDMLCPNCKSDRMILSEKRHSSNEDQIPPELQLPETELRIMSVLAAHEGAMFASEIAMELDCSPKLVGTRAKTLLERELVQRGQKKGKSIYSLTSKARGLYFDQSKIDAITIGKKVNDSIVAVRNQNRQSAGRTGHR